MRLYNVSNGTSEVIQAESIEEAREKFFELVNECRCEQLTIEEIKHSPNLKKPSRSEE